MEVLSTCPLRVASLVWQPRAGAHTQTIVCKATFDLAPDRSPLSATPANLVAFDEHEGRDPRKSLTAASDLVPFKPRPEVLLTGSAYAPQGRPVRHLLASLTVGPVDKSIAVYLNGQGIPDLDPRGHRVTDDSFMICFNAHYEPIQFTLPSAEFGAQWKLVIDTANPANGGEILLPPGGSGPVQARSLVVLQALEGQGD